MPNYNKIVYGGKTLIDLTSDTIDKSKLLVGATAHDKSGAVIEGACDFDVNSQDATAAVAELLEGKTAYARGSRLVGTMPNRAAFSGSIAEKDEAVNIPMGFHDGSGAIGLSETEKAKLIAANIREGITLLGVVGEMSGTEDSKPQAKSAVPTTAEQVILPDEGYNCLSQVTVSPIPYSESDNSAGGVTVTIG